MPLPGPSGNPVSPEVEHYAHLLDEIYPGAGYGIDFINYFNTHPNANPLKVFDTIVTRLTAFKDLGKVLPQTIQAALNAGSNIINAIPSATKSIAPGNVLQNWLTGLTQRSLWVRIAEVIAGGSLIIIGVAHLMNVKPTEIAATAAKVVK